MILDDGDIARLARGVGLTEWVFVQRYTRLSPNRNQLVLKDGPDGACVFLDNDRCRVYDARPDQCRAFPHVWSVEGPCPGRHAGP